MIWRIRCEVNHPKSHSSLIWNHPEWCTCRLSFFDLNGGAACDFCRCHGNRRSSQRHPNKHGPLDAADWSCLFYESPQQPSAASWAPARGHVLCHEDSVWSHRDLGRSLSDLSGAAGQIRCVWCRETSGCVEEVKQTSGFTVNRLPLVPQGT